MAARRAGGAWRAWPACVAAAAVALAAPPAAGAHAVLVAAVPASGVAPSSPRQILLRLSEQVENAFGAVMLLDGSGRRVELGTISRPTADAVAVPVEQRLARGTYTVVWRVVSSDSHPVAGSYSFSVGAPGPRPPSPTLAALVPAASGAVSAVTGALRFLDFALLLLCVGGATTLALVVGETRALLRRRLRGGLAALAVALAAVDVARIAAQGADEGGFGLDRALHWSVLSTVLATRFGELSVAGAVGALVLAVAVAAGRSNRSLVLVPAAALALGPPLEGHALAEGPLTVAADGAHLVAAAVWTGGLASLVLVLLLAGKERWSLAVEVVPRFSKLAVAAVALLVAAGAVNAYLEVRTPAAFWETTYGRLLGAKIGIVGVLLALGLFNNRWAVPRIAAGAASAVARARFVRAVSAELGLMIAAVAVTTFLVAEPPAKAAVAAKAARIARPANASTPAPAFFTTATSLGPFGLELGVSPDAVGINTIDLLVTDRAGRPVELSRVFVTASLPRRGLGQLRFRADRLAPGHFVVDVARLRAPGAWRLQIRARLLQRTISVPVAGRMRPARSGRPGEATAP